MQAGFDCLRMPVQPAGTGYTGERFTVGGVQRLRTSHAQCIATRMVICRLTRIEQSHRSIGKTIGHYSSIIGDCDPVCPGY